ncbi:MAG TPA: SpoIIE family protein phosphatase [Bacteroidales bacterium]|nr:SpoIIE family protein phosphatase [Bacteroidales bacterium]
MHQNYHIEIDCQQKYHDGERICGDVFLFRRIEEENRVIIVLSDGMGHGVKANILATLTATMSMNFTLEHKEVQRIADIIMNTLPVCSEREMSYSTFTIIDIENDEKITILEYDNPQAVIIRGKKLYQPEWKNITLETERNAGKKLHTCSFSARKEDRILFCTDGVTQSGTGSKALPTGWGRDGLEEFLLRQVASNTVISARDLALKVVTIAHKNDQYSAKDDISCASLYFREPRKLLVVTGPPVELDRDKEMAQVFKNFEGKKIVAGATTADILARELDIEIINGQEFDDPELPPVSFMPEAELVTEGILTLSKVSRMLDEYTPAFVPGKGPADQFFKLLKDSDEIRFLVGTSINLAHQDPNLPVELEIRRTVVKRIARKLQELFLKHVTINYI